MMSSNWLRMIMDNKWIEEEFFENFLLNMVPNLVYNIIYFFKKTNYIIGLLSHAA